MYKKAPSKRNTRYVFNSASITEHILSIIPKTNSQHMSAIILRLKCVIA